MGKKPALRASKVGAASPLTSWRRILQSANKEEEDLVGDAVSDTGGEPSTKDTVTKEANDNQEKATTDDDWKRDSEETIQTFELSFSAIAVEHNTSKLRLGDIRPPVVECALTNILCLETDLNMTSATTGKDPCFLIRSTHSKTPAYLGGSNMTFVVMSEPRSGATLVTRLEEVSYLELMISYSAIPNKAVSDVGEIDPVELQTLQNIAQFATNARIEDGTFDDLLDSCYKGILASKNGDDDTNRDVQLDLYSSVTGREFETFEAFAPDIKEADEPPEWQLWFSESYYRIVGMAAVAGVIVVVAALLCIHHRRKAKKWVSTSHLETPIALKKAKTGVTRHSDQSSSEGQDDDDDEVFNTTCFQRKPKTPEGGLGGITTFSTWYNRYQGSESSVTCDDYEDKARVAEDDFSLYAESDGVDDAIMNLLDESIQEIESMRTEIEKTEGLSPSADTGRSAPQLRIVEIAVQRLSGSLNSMDHAVSYHTKNDNAASQLQEKTTYPHLATPSHDDETAILGISRVPHTNESAMFRVRDLDTGAVSVLESVGSF